MSQRRWRSNEHIPPRLDQHRKETGKGRPACRRGRRNRRRAPDAATNVAAEFASDAELCGLTHSAPMPSSTPTTAIETNIVSREFRRPSPSRADRTALPADAACRCGRCGFATRSRHIRRMSSSSHFSSARRNRPKGPRRIPLRTTVARRRERRRPRPMESMRYGPPRRSAHRR